MQASVLNARAFGGRASEERTKHLKSLQFGGDMSQWLRFNLLCCSRMNHKNLFDAFRGEAVSA